LALLWILKYWTFLYVVSN